MSGFGSRRVAGEMKLNEIVMNINIAKVGLPTVPFAVVGQNVFSMQLIARSKRWTV